MSLPAPVCRTFESDVPATDDARLVMILARFQNDLAHELRNPFKRTWPTSFLDYLATSYMSDCIVSDVADGHITRDPRAMPRPAHAPPADLTLVVSALSC